ncbi:MAG TPA: FKBP-type peptidyl-prolyl cis-trans isomerase [Myxococcota bacterium]
MSIRLLACVGVAALALGCSKQEDAAASAAPAAPASAPVAAKNPGAPDGSPFSVTHQVEGSGAMPTEADTVRVHYAGRLADGSEFDSSIARGEPATFPLSGVIPCWTQGVAQMKVGGKATLVCPPDLAYGASGVPGVIPPEATLTFDVELLAIESAPQ